MTPGLDVGSPLLAPDDQARCDGRPCLGARGEGRSCLGARGEGHSCLGARGDGRPCLGTRCDGRPCVGARGEGRPCLGARGEGRPCLGARGDHVISALGLPANQPIGFQVTGRSRHMLFDRPDDLGQTICAGAQVIRPHIVLGSHARRLVSWS